LKKITLLSWSSGKDSAWALHILRRDPSIDVVGLFCTVNQQFNRVAMHAVRLELLRQQAERVGLPLTVIEIPYPCSNEQYAERMQAFVERARQNHVQCFAFGDLFLQDVRQYREDKLKNTGIEAIFPLWGTPTQALSRQMIKAGLKARITCIDPECLPPDCLGREYNVQFLQQLPGHVDPCGEYGEFHSFAFDGPMFREPVTVQVGDYMRRDGFLFADLILSD
jgi:uncharacterized protein (TIGR00290 family)